MNALWLRYTAPTLLAALAACGGSAAPCPAWAPPLLLGPLQHTRIREVSGLAADPRTPGVQWTVEDSGAAAEVHAWSGTGRHLGVVRLEGVTLQDAEALAVVPCGNATCAFVGDIGDNLAARSHVVVWRLELPEAALGLDASVPPQSLALSYPEGPQDAEALVVGPDLRPVIFTKRTDGISRVYRAPRAASSNTLTLEHALDLQVSISGAGGLPSAVTDASLHHGGHRLLLRTYAGAWEWLHAGNVIQALGEAERAPVAWPVEIQGESVSYDGRGWLAVSEGPLPPLYRMVCLGPLN